MELDLFEFELEDGQVYKEASSPASTGGSSWGSSAIDESYLAVFQAPEHVREAVFELEAEVHGIWPSLKEQRLSSLALLLAHKYPCVVLRTGLGPESPTESMRQLRHSFIICRTHEGVELVIDPSFSDQFSIGKADEEYMDFLSTVPTIFVGTAAMLQASVKLICRDMHEAMGRLGLPRPPWRDVASLMTKWLPTSYKDERFLPPIQAMIPGFGSGILRKNAGGAAGTGTQVSFHSSGLVARQATTIKRKKEVVTISNAVPRISVVGFNARPQVVSNTSMAGSGTPGAGLHRGHGSRLSGASSVVSSLSDEWALAQKCERQSARAAVVDGEAKARVKTGEAGLGKQQAQQQQAQQQQAQQPGRFKPLDQLLPAIRTVRLGA